MERYGEETGREIFDTMFGNYKRIGILDTHCYDMEPVKEETLRICDCLHLGMTVLEASNNRLQKLLTGPYPDDQFLVIPPQTTIQESDLSVE